METGRTRSIAAVAPSGAVDRYSDSRADSALLHYKDAGAHCRHGGRQYTAIAIELASAWGTGTAFIDCQWLPYWIDNRSRECCTANICRVARDTGVTAIPVVRPRDSRLVTEIGKSLMAGKYGVALRLSVMDFAHGHVKVDVARTLDALGLQRWRVDLIIDYGEWYAWHPPITDLLAALGHENRWRTVTFLCGSFPENLEDFSEGLHVLKRKEWHWWLEQQRSLLTHGQLLSFGDYTTQFPIFKEPPDGCNPSVSVRYALSDSWLVSRGQGIEQGRSGQWIGHARLLSQHQRFLGPEFSAGSKYVADRCGENASPGSFSTWVQAGVNQQLEVTAGEIAALRATVTGSRPSLRVAERPSPIAARRIERE
jgi:hypothetical protein